MVRISSVARRPTSAAATVIALCAVLAAAAGCGGNATREKAKKSEKPVTFARVQGVFAKYGCMGCHPGVNPSLDLTPRKAYGQLVGVRAVEDPRLVRVVAGDPRKSFLFEKIAGDPALGGIPAVGARMPQGAPRMSQGDIDVVRSWILQGAKNARGKTVGPTVPTAGSPGPSPTGDPATRPRGDAAISGIVEDERHRPLRGALVTLLLRGSSQEGGEEHYRVALTNRNGGYSLPHAPTGQYLLKAYAPKSIYVSRIVSVKPGQRARIDFGLPARVVSNPTISAPRVGGSDSTTRLSMHVAGSSLDGNYTLAVHAASGQVFELRRSDGGPGRWARTLTRRLPGRWIFLAVDHQCNISDFITASF